MNNGGSNMLTPYVQFGDNLLSFNTDIDDQRKTNLQAGTILSKNIQARYPFEKSTLLPYSASQIIDHRSTGEGQTFQNVNVTKTSVYDIKVDSDVRKPLVTGISVNSDGGILLADNHNKKVKMITADRERVLHLDLNEWCFDVIVYNENTAFVTGMAKLFFIDISGVCLTLQKKKKKK